MAWKKQPPVIRGSGWVVQSLKAALWAFLNAASFEEAVLKAVNLGDDADTTGAVCGQFAGAYWGESGIAESLRSGLARQDMIEEALEGIVLQWLGGWASARGQPEFTMSWFQRLLGGKQPSKPSGAVPVQPTLAAAGWQLGRTCDLTKVEQALRQSGFPLHEAARHFLTEYHGLALDVPVAGADGIAGFVHFDPEKVLRMLAPTDLPRLAVLMPKAICPIGTTSGHTMFVFLDEAGMSYLLDMEWTLFAELAGSPAETVRVLCDGRNGRVDSVILDDQGRPTRQMIRGGDEQRHWQVSQFPGIARFLPPVSLSPARRPPTWRPMVRAAEQTLAQGGSPSMQMVTCGGFCSSPSGQWYFVAHCENSLYVRAKAGFQVTPPPPGIPARFKTGEILPFQKPPGW